MSIQGPNSRAWHAGEDIDAMFLRVKLEVDATFPAGHKLMLAGVGERAYGHVANSCKEDTAENRRGYAVSSSVRRLGFDAETVGVAGAAITSGQLLRAGALGRLIPALTVLTGVAGEADDEILTKVAHGLLTGDEVEITGGTGFTGVTLGRSYFVVRLGADTFSLAETRALAVAETPTVVNVTVDGSAGVLTVKSPVVGQALEAQATAGKTFSYVAFGG